MSTLERIGIVEGDTAGARAVAGAVTSLLGALGRWVEPVPPAADLAAYAAVVTPRASGWRALRARYAGPLLVIDADLLDGRAEPAFAHLLGGPAVPAMMVGETRALLPRALPPLAGPAFGARGAGLTADAGGGVGYALPAVVTPALRTVAGFWSLAGVLEEALAGLLGASSALYVEPWPRGFRAARALTYDLDGLEQAALPALVGTGRPATLFCCADALDRLGTPAPGLELAAHGDVHRPFDDPERNLARVDRMRAAFAAAGFAPRGFSPPNLTYTSAVEPLLQRFGYLRLGYQERTLAFLPQPLAGGVLASVSYYPDFMQRYVGPAEYGRLLARFCAWAEATSVLAVPCFHPCLWSEPLACFLDTPRGAAWETTLGEIVDWWTHRTRALAAVAADGEAAAPPDVVVVRASSEERLAALRPPDGEASVPAGRRAVARVIVAGRAVSVLPAADSAAAGVDVPLARGWRALGWLPGGMRRRLVRVANKNGLHACFYGDLGLEPDVRRRALHLPVVAADEPLMMTHPTPRDLGRIAGRLVRRLAGESHA
jgi:hypothetical protein